MRATRTAIAIVSLSGILLMAIGATATAVAGGRPFSGTMTGAAEAPGPGDPDGTGTFSLTINPGTGQVCYDYSVSGIANLTAAHIHRAPAGVPGPVVVPLPPTSATGGSDCVVAERSILLDILRDPSAFYINVHNADFPAGALRAQLER
jgi:hypothetical protein